jgi:hypothetical protein
MSYIRCHDGMARLANIVLHSSSKHDVHHTADERIHDY